MNIFILDARRNKCAKYLADKHVVKMVLETAQLLCTAFRIVASPELVHRVEQTGKVYAVSHRNHPCAVWARERLVNAVWLAGLGERIAAEYQRRYGRRHASLDVIRRVARALKSTPPQALAFPRREQLVAPVDFPIAMPQDIRGGAARATPGRAVSLYREYYTRKLAEPWAKYEGSVLARPPWKRLPRE